MRRLGIALLALAVLAAVTTAPARAAACGGKPALTAGCCCKGKAPAPKAPCCQVAPATSDAAVLSGVTAVTPDLAFAPVALAVPPAPGLELASSVAVPKASPPGSPPVFLLDCTFRI